MSQTVFAAPVAKLFSYGHASSRGDWPNYVEELGLRAEHIAELIEIVVRSDLSHVNSGFPVEESAANHALQQHNPAAHFLRLSWSANAEVFMTLAGAQVRTRTLRSLVFDWPLNQPGRSVEMEIRNEGALLIVTMFAWMMPVAQATKDLVEVLAADLDRRPRADGSSVDLDWQYSDEHSEPVVLSLSEVFQATDGAWADASKAAVRRLASMFVALDPVVRSAIDGEFEAQATRDAVGRMLDHENEGEGA